MVSWTTSVGGKSRCHNFSPPLPPPRLLVHDRVLLILTHQSSLRTQATFSWYILYKTIPLIKYLLPASYKLYSTINSNFVQVPFICSLQFIHFLSSRTPVPTSPVYRTSKVKKTQQISAVPPIRAIYIYPNLR